MRSALLLLAVALLTACRDPFAPERVRGCGYWRRDIPVIGGPPGLTAHYTAHLCLTPAEAKAEGWRRVPSLDAP